MQGLLQRLSSATQAFNFRALSEHPAAARHIAEATVNTGTHEQLLRAAVAAIVRPSSRFVAVTCFFMWAVIGLWCLLSLACDACSHLLLIPALDLKRLLLSSWEEDPLQPFTDNSCAILQHGRRKSPCTAHLAFS